MQEYPSATSKISIPKSQNPGKNHHFLGYFIHEILKNRVRPPCSDDFHLPCKTQKTHSFMRSGYH